MARGWAVAAVTVAVLAATWVLIFGLRRWLVARAILDRPVARSSHRVPVPRGAGLALLPALVAGVLALAAAGWTPAGTVVAMAAAIGLALVSWLDDLHGMPIPARLAAQALAVLAGLAALGSGAVFQGLLPPLTDRALAGVLWLWFVNLYNFMDGIDGIAAGETVALGVGVALTLARAGTSDDGAAWVALLVAAAGLGFLPWNWHPARIFLGDVGSVPLGYILGWLLLGLAGRGLWAPALILPLYYLADASITLGLRLHRRARVWQAHREHFYQRAVGRDGDHAAVVRFILAGNAVLVALAVIAVRAPWAALALAAGAVAALLALLRRRALHGG
jgi:UDP-N-acetylmuramyl pentapeptide phosphotransferase/UDP-N-acetylglucosamine-1-phosphate transferase